MVFFGGDDVGVVIVFFLCMVDIIQFFNYKREGNGVKG